MEISNNRKRAYNAETLRAIEILNTATKPMTVAAICRATKLGRSTIYRDLPKLVEGGHLYEWKIGNVKCWLRKGFEDDKVDELRRELNKERIEHANIDSKLFESRQKNLKQKEEIAALHVQIERMRELVNGQCNAARAGQLMAELIDITHAMPDLPAEHWPEKEDVA